jgi:hypothetical protein
MNAAFKAAALSWIRASAAAVAALYMAGETNPKTLAAAGVSGLIGPALKWLDSSAKEFGRGSK